MTTVRTTTTILAALLAALVLAALPLPAQGASLSHHRFDIFGTLAGLAGGGGGGANTAANTAAATQQASPQRQLPQRQTSAAASTTPKSNPGDGGAGSGEVPGQEPGTRHRSVVIFDFPPGYFGQGGSGAGMLRLMNPNSLPNNNLNLNPFQPNLPLMGTLENQSPNNEPSAVPVGANVFGGLRYKEVMASDAPAPHHSFSFQTCTNCVYDS